MDATALSSLDKPDVSPTSHDRAVAGWRNILQHITRIRRLQRFWAYLGVHLQHNVPRVRNRIRELL
eukprot:7915870-Lingulodinium_polyedra.AAC.1